MADIFVDPGLNKIHAAISTANSGDRLILRDGTYTHSGSYCINFLAINKVFNSLTIQAEHEHQAIVDFSGTAEPVIQGRNATEGGGLGLSEGIKWNDLVMQGAPAGGKWFGEDSLDRYTGWEFNNIKLGPYGGTGNAPFCFVFRPSKSMVFNGITTLSTFNASSVIRFTRGFIATPPALDLKIVNCDFRNHDGAAFLSPLLFQDVSDVRIRGCTIDMKGRAPIGTAVYPIDFEGVTAALTMGGYQVTECNIYNTGPGAGAHIIFNCYGNGTIMENIHVDRCNVHDSQACDGIEIDAGPADSGAIIRNAHVSNTTTENIPTYAVIFASNVQKGSIKNCTSINCDDAVRFHGCSDVIADGVIAVDCHNLAKWSGYAGMPSPAVRSMIRNSVAIRCQQVYEVQTANAAFATARDTAPRLGKNIVSAPVLPSRFALVDAVAKTQAQFEALYPNSIDESDVEITPWPAFGTPTERACRLVNANGAPTGYTLNEALTELSKRGVPIWNPKLW